MNKISLALDALFTRYQNLHHSEKGSLPQVQFDPPWPSPCTELESNNSNDGLLFWHPVARDSGNIFSDLETALEFGFHPDIVEFYGAFWSNGLCTRFSHKEQGEFSFNLIQLWNQEDEERLKENLLGHAFAKLKSRLPMTFFIGCTDGNDVICLDQDTGEIVLEKPGFKAHLTLAANLEAFLLGLDPTLDDYS